MDAGDLEESKNQTIMKPYPLNKVQRKFLLRLQEIENQEKSISFFFKENTIQILREGKYDQSQKDILNGSVKDRYEKYLKTR